MKFLASPVIKQVSRQALNFLLTGEANMANLVVVSSDLKIAIISTGRATGHMMVRTAIRVFLGPGALISILILLQGCVPEATVRDEPVKAVEKAIFYPPLPNPPRIQYLTTFSTNLDVVGEAVKEGEKGTFLRFVLGEESEVIEGPIKPYGVALHEGKIYVTDMTGDGYAIFDLQNHKYRFVRGFGAAALPSPINITIDSDGTKYITDTIKNQIMIYDEKDKFVRAYGLQGQFRPGDVAISGNKLYVSDLDRHNVQILDKATGDFISYLAAADGEPLHYYYPTNLALGPDDDLYVSETGSFRVSKNTPDGEQVQFFGEIGDAPGNLARPKGIAVDHKGNLYVVDGAFQNVQIFNKDGRLLLFFGEHSMHPSGLDLPTDILIDYSNISYFQRYADPNFQLEYIILVANQFGANKVVVYGYGKMKEMYYEDEE